MSHGPRSAGLNSMTCLLFHVTKRVNAYVQRLNGYYRAIPFRPLFQTLELAGAIDRIERHRSATPDAGSIDLRQLAETWIRPASSI